MIPLPPSLFPVIALLTVERCFSEADLQLTLAMGVSHWNPDQKRDVEDALNEADKKMYVDKRESG